MRPFWRHDDSEGAEPGTVAPDRDAIISYLNDHDIVPPADATTEQLQAQALVLEAAAHARFLETYQPVITRLPDAVGTTPEQPEPVEDTSGGAQPVAADSPVEPAEPVASAEATPEAGPATGTEEQPQAAPSPGADEQPQP